jgi:hypothetical protein
MSILQGLVSYPGLSTFTRAEYVLSLGISPGKCTIEMPQELVQGLQQTGDLTFSYGQQSITLPDCVLDQAHVSAGEGGFIARVDILDRRWRWADGSLSGHWNLRMPSGSCADEGFNAAAVQVNGDVTKIRSGTEKAPQDIATACLNAMGEQSFDVSQLPNDARPEIAWSHVNAAKALQELCEGLGCRVAYVVASDSVQIVSIGQGNGLPQNQSVQWVSTGMNPPETPSALRLVGGPTIFQGFIPLIAVGIEINDGSVQPINNLSYAPPNGWTGASFSTIKDPTTRALAEECIFKMWLINGPQIQVPATANTPAWLNGATLKTTQIKLYDRLLDTHNNPTDPAQIIHKKPQIWGTYNCNYAQKISTPTDKNVIYKTGVRVDPDRWLIFTDDRLTQTTTDGKCKAANVQLKIAYSILHSTDATTGGASSSLEPSRWYYTRTLNSTLTTKPEEVHKEEIYLKVVGQFDETDFTLTGATDNVNSDNLSQETNYYLDAAQAQYVEVDSLDVPYVGLIPIQVDGLISQVTYSISEKGTTTRASLATEHNPYVLPYKRAKMLHDQEAQAEQLRRDWRYYQKHRHDAMPGCL